MKTLTRRNPRAEAQSLLPAGHEARVLEPSPPANTDPSWFADDPTDPSGAKGTVVTPIDGEGVSWEAVASDNSGLRPFITSRWLGDYARLVALPEGFSDTRQAMHQLAFFAIAPKRQVATGKIGLRFTYRGFGTPFFGDDEQIRVEDGTLVYQRKGEASQSSVVTLRHACEFLGTSYWDPWFEGFQDPPPPLGPDRELEASSNAAAALGDWFGFGTSVLEQARRTEGATDVSRVQLWPEHFDLAFEMGTGESRASYGASPGDAAHPDPYLYISAWEEIDRSEPFWNDSAFNGASFSYRMLLEAPDQRRAALEFFDRGFRKLSG